MRGRYAIAGTILSYGTPNSLESYLSHLTRSVVEREVSLLRSEGLIDERNKSFMAKGYLLGLTKAACKTLNFRDIDTYMKLHDEFKDILMLPLGEVPVVVTRDQNHIRSLLEGAAFQGHRMLLLI